ncbi:hypothetical protein [uncultured Ruminococcus sp.]|jgi:hypothetical protein|uniref:hypothetical protein n=1 Tax=uncultured Ruminococcus sp. TaxID=165186 RepID=UPI0025CF6A4F|nr:hypothetical protein [uncultured Ruminococcus sp.]
MNTLNINGTAKVTKRYPMIFMSAAACAAVVIGIAVVNMNKKNSKPLPVTTQDRITTDAQTFTKDEGSTSENVMTVTEQDGNSYTITDIDRIEAIDAIVENAKKCHVWEGHNSKKMTQKFSISAVTYMFTRGRMSRWKYHSEKDDLIFRASENCNYYMTRYS